jgi:hypothetical protein
LQGTVKLSDEANFLAMLANAWCLEVFASIGIGYGICYLQGLLVLPSLSQDVSDAD